MCVVVFFIIIYVKNTIYLSLFYCKIKIVNTKLMTDDTQDPNSKRMLHILNASYLSIKQKIG